MKMKLLDKVERYLKENDWNYGIPSRTDGVVMLGFEGENGRWHCMLQVREEQNQLLFYSKCMVNVPLKHRQKMVDFITDANYRLAVGNYEMDRTDGELSFKTGIDVDDIEVTGMMIRNLMMTNLATYDKILPDIENIMGDTNILPTGNDVIELDFDGERHSAVRDSKKDWDDSMGGLQ
jgi:hypothetical protein